MLECFTGATGFQGAFRAGALHATHLPGTPAHPSAPQPGGEPADGPLLPLSVALAVRFLRPRREEAVQLFGDRFPRLPGKCKVA